MSSSSLLLFPCLFYLSCCALTLLVIGIYANAIFFIKANDRAKNNDNANNRTTFTETSTIGFFAHNNDYSKSSFRSSNKSIQIEHLTTAGNRNETTAILEEFEFDSKKEVMSVNYYRNSKTFTKNLIDCLLQDDCHVYYHHIPKTGGSAFEYAMLNAFPFYKTKEKTYNSCCSEGMMERFEKDKKSHCDANFSSYQVSVSNFKKVVSDCMSLNESKASRAVILVSFREPAARTLSLIHQTCNKNWEWRTNETKLACLSCDYHNSKSFFDSMVNVTNEVYQGIIDLITTNFSRNVTVMTFEMDEINNILLELNSRMSSHYKFPIENRNKEVKSTCDFAMPSVMFKGLAPSFAVYKTLHYGF